MDTKQKLILKKAWKNISNIEKQLLKRILDISFKHKLAHLGSCLSALPIIYNIYLLKEEKDIFILSCGHAGLALYVVLEHFYGINAEELLKKHGVHPNRDLKNNIYCSTGSLGLGLPIAVGSAISNKDKKVFCLISDGECAEGSIWESLCFIYKQSINNIIVLVNINGYSALEEINTSYLKTRLKTFLPKIITINTPSNFTGIPNGLEAHYHILSKDNYEEAIKQFII